MVQSLGLSDEQRARIAETIEKRHKALAAAAPDARAGVIEANDAQLMQVLTADQAAQFQQLKPEPRLQFNFRFQRWTDVLEWLAEQADLSLVMDAPPPGTFNYSDTRDYTPTEAIDLLNGVLIGKGYTLIRRGRMLMVVDISQGIPENLVPRVTLPELEHRGKFELVSVVLPLGRRQTEQVTAEIQPLLGTNGKVVPLPATKQLLITGSAGMMKSIAAVLESIPEPETKREREPEKPEPPVLEIHPITTFDPNVAIDLLGKLLPSAKLALDQTANQISAYAPPSQQAAIKKVLEQMAANNPPDKKPRMEVYPLPPDERAARMRRIGAVVESAGAQLVATLQPMLADAKLTFDSQSNSIVAWATPEQHETIKTAIDKLGQARSVSNTRQLQVYPLTKAEPSTVEATLERLVPDARVSLDAATRSLIVFAVPVDHEAIRASLD
ncbi:MAG: hypothetical protein KJZ87_06220, partial [Thermoguttaceae bacterium]|nr:hypothetical protein [Thermoguttaceae bacterium]